DHPQDDEHGAPDVDHSPSPPSVVAGTVVVGGVSVSGVSSAAAATGSGGQAITTTASSRFVSVNGRTAAVSVWPWGRAPATISPTGRPRGNDNDNWEVTTWSPSETAFADSRTFNTISAEPMTGCSVPNWSPTVTVIPSTSRISGTTCAPPFH